MDPFAGMITQQQRKRAACFLDCYWKVPTFIKQYESILAVESDGEFGSSTAMPNASWRIAGTPLSKCLFVVH
jgi:hypothetical protein